MLQVTPSGTPPVSEGTQPRRRSSSVGPGHRLGRYELLSLIARGGMAEVWSARQTGELGFSRIVALKTIRPDHTDENAFRKAFLEEARIASRLRHVNVVEVLDLGDKPVLFQAMSLIEGDSVGGLLEELRDRAQDKVVGIRPAIAARIMIDALAGLHAAHELCDERAAPMKLVHRDVSPQNILVGVDGVAKLADFGIAKARGRLAEETEIGQLRGKLGYLSPEQIQRMPLDRRSDLFSAGIVLWEMLTGQPLFRGADILETIGKISHGSIPDPRVHVRELPEDLVAVCMRALDRDRNARWQSAQAMGDALDWAARRVAQLASPREVGALVQELSGGRIAAQRAEIERALTAGVPAVTDRVSTDVSGAPSEVEPTFSGTELHALPRRRNKIAAIAAGALMVCTVAAGWAWSDASNPTVAVEQVAPEPQTAETEVVAAEPQMPAAVLATQPAPVVQIAPVQAAQVAAPVEAAVHLEAAPAANPAEPRMLSNQPHRGHLRPASPRPKFANPYR